MRIMDKMRKYIGRNKEDSHERTRFLLYFKTIMALIGIVALFVISLILINIKQADLSETAAMLSMCALALLVGLYIWFERKRKQMQAKTPEQERFEAAQKAALSMLAKDRKNKEEHPENYTEDARARLSGRGIYLPDKIDVIENWRMLIDRVTGEDANKNLFFFNIQMGAFDELRQSGHMLNKNGKTVADTAREINPEERLRLIGRVGTYLSECDIEPTYLNANIQLADEFKNCIYIALAATLENLNDVIKYALKNSKYVVRCNYTYNGGDDPLGDLLPSLEEWYPWAKVEAYPQPTEKNQNEPKRLGNVLVTKIFEVDSVTKVETMRTVFSGDVRKGTIRINDVLNVIDNRRTFLCREGAVLSMYVNMKEVHVAKEGQHIDELCLAVEIPSGDYTGMILIDDEATLNLKG